MLVKSSKSRVAAIAIMALGVSTFMGTSAALATPVNVTGTVGDCQVASTVSASAVTFGTVIRAETGVANLAFTVTEGKTATCDDRDSTVTAAITSLTGEADNTNANLTSTKLVVLNIGTLSGTSFPMTATVPAGAAEQAFGATVTLTLIG
jgi:hypothetical protein